MDIDSLTDNELRRGVPSPLPYVSRRALTRVKDAAPVPVDCRYCHGRVALVSNATVYGREYGDWPFIYHCRTCDAYVGLHPNTDIPLGTLANADLRNARKTCKSQFNRMMQAKRVPRTKAYWWLADKMQIPREACHWGMFEIEQCEQAGDICRRAIETGDMP